jgi:hypothetical protein
MNRNFKENIESHKSNSNVFYNIISLIDKLTDSLEGKFIDKKFIINV